MKDDKDVHFAINESTVYRRAYKEPDPHCLTGFELELESRNVQHGESSHYASSAMIGENKILRQILEICVEMQT